MPSHTITSTSTGVTLTSAGYYNPVTVEAGVIISSASIAIDAPTKWTIYNFGSVTDTGTPAIQMEHGGTVINGQSGSTVAAAYIYGSSIAVYMTGDAGSVANYGTLLGGGSDGVFLEAGGTVTNGASGASGAQIRGFSGVFVFAPAATVNNDGSIIGTSGNGVLLAQGGNVVNGATDPTTSTALISGSSYGVEIAGTGGTVTNYGTLLGTGAYGARLYGGTLVNGVTGANVALISGYGGVEGYANSVNVTNYGTITGTDDGVALNNGGSIDNAQANATITGGNGGVDIFGGGTVSNLGTIIGTALHGVYLFNGGNVINGAAGASISSALISGGYYGIRVGFDNAAGGTVTNYGTVIGAGSHPSPPSAKYSAVLIDGYGSVVNSGIIRDDTANSFDRAVRFNHGGVVSNATSGTIAGDGSGVYIAGGAGTVDNAGSISGVNPNGGVGVYMAAGGSVSNTTDTALIRGAADGIDVSGGSGTVTNSGTIMGFGPLDGGLSTSMGVALYQGGSVTNGQSGSTVGHIYGYDSAVFIDGPTNGGSSLGTGTVANFGTIIGHSQFGVELREGGTVTNGASGASASSAYVYGYSYGVETDFANASSAPNVLGTVMNFGTIISAANGSGVALRSGGIVINAQDATITGGYGVSAFGYSNGGPTVVNAGTIIGTGVNHFAVFFETANDLLVDVPGAVFDGTVAAAGTATLELASAAGIGTLSGVGSYFTSFDSITVDDNAQWTVTGTNTVAGNTPITINTDADLEINGTLTGAADFMLRGGTLGVANAVDAGATFDFTDQAGFQPDDLILSAVTGSSFDNAITGFGGSDEIVVPNVAFVAGSTPVIGGGAVTIDVQGGGTFTFSDFAFQNAAPELLTVGAHSIQDAACFAAGTMILTASGEVAIEQLRPGDRVVTLDGASRPVRWIGHRRIDLMRHPEPSRAQPIRVRPDAIAAGLPNRDLLVSPDHALFVDRGLVAARLLLNGASITRETEWRTVHYFHVELDAHDILFANGMPTESYLDTGNRGMFENADEPLILHADFAMDEAQRRREAELCAPFISDVAQLKLTWRRLAQRSEAMGRMVPVATTTDDPALRVFVGDNQLKLVDAGEGRCVFAVPHGASVVRLVSRATAPCEVVPWIDDSRQLGVMLRRIVLHRGSDRCDIAPDHPTLCDGWWPPEGSGDQLWRWSNGNACLTLPEGTTLVELHIGTGCAAYLAHAVTDQTALRAA